MIDISNWHLYWNLEGDEKVRANLVYSAYVSPDNRYFCQWFSRDERYHPHKNENDQWTDELLEDRFRRELTYHSIAEKHMPVLKIDDIDEKERKVVYEWPGDDFLMQSIKMGGRENVCPDWKQQWLSLIESMWRCDITKLSLHPNSWTVIDGVMYPMNWFFSYTTTKESDSFQNLLIQISPNRLEKMHKILDTLDIKLEETYPVKKLQEAAFNSFRSNYDNDLIDGVLEKL